jgi:hypothetical protein
MNSPKAKYNLLDNSTRSYWRGFSQRELDIILDAIKNSIPFQMYLRDLGLDIRKFGGEENKESAFEETIRRIVAEELAKVKGSV